MVQIVMGCLSNLPQKGNLLTRGSLKFEEPSTGTADVLP